MNQNELLKIKNEIERIAKEAGTLIVNKENLVITEKSDAANIVTNMDVASQNYIISECKKLIPESCFLAEEEGKQQLGEEYTWVIDPIDGTTNYAYDFKHSCISIALLYQKKGLIGVIYDPYLKECFTGIEGMQSTCNGKVIHASNHAANHALVMIGTSPYHKEYADETFDLCKRLFLHCRDIRRSGSAALDICYVASGRVDAFYESLLSPWDYAAGLIIAKNAQVKFQSLKKQQFDYQNPVGILAANSNCFDEIKELIGESNE